MLEDLAEQQRSIVVLKGPGHEPVVEPFASVAATVAPAAAFDHRSDVQAAEPSVDFADVAAERAG